MKAAAAESESDSEAAMEELLDAVRVRNECMYARLIALVTFSNGNTFFFASFADSLAGLSKESTGVKWAYRRSRGNEHASPHTLVQLHPIGDERTKERKNFSHSFYLIPSESFYPPPPPLRIGRFR